MIFLGINLNTSTPVALNKMEQKSNVPHCGRSLPPVPMTELRTKGEFAAFAQEAAFVRFADFHYSSKSEAVQENQTGIIVHYTMRIECSSFRSRNHRRAGKRTEKHFGLPAGMDQTRVRQELFGQRFILWGRMPAALIENSHMTIRAD